jgi:hypothetical protein
MASSFGNVYPAGLRRSRKVVAYLLRHLFKSGQVKGIGFS